MIKISCRRPRTDQFPSYATAYEVASQATFGWTARISSYCIIPNLMEKVDDLVSEGKLNTNKVRMKEGFCMKEINGFSYVFYSQQRL